MPVLQEIEASKHQPRIWLLKHRPPGSLSRREQMRDERRRLADPTTDVGIAGIAARRAERASLRAQRIQLRGGAIGGSTQIAAARALARAAAPKVARGPVGRRPQRGVIDDETQAQFKAFQAREQLKAAPALLAAFNKKLEVSRAAAAKRREQKALVAREKQAQADLVVKLRAQKRIDDAKSKRARFRTLAITGPTTFEEDTPDTGPAFPRAATIRGRVAGLPSLSLAAATSALAITRPPKDPPPEPRGPIFLPSDVGRGRQDLGTEGMSDRELARAFVAGRITGQQLRERGELFSAGVLELKPARFQSVSLELRKDEEANKLFDSIDRVSERLQQIGKAEGSRFFLSKLLTPPSSEVRTAVFELNKEISDSLIQLKDLGRLDRQKAIDFLIGTGQFKLLEDEFRPEEFRSQLRSERARLTVEGIQELAPPIAGLGPLGGPIRGAKGLKFDFKSGVGKLKVFRKNLYNFRPTKFFTEDTLAAVQRHLNRFGGFRRGRISDVRRGAAESPGDAIAGRARVADLAEEVVTSPSSAAFTERRLSALAADEARSPFLSKFQEAGQVLKTGFGRGGRGMLRTGRDIVAPFGRIAVITGGMAVALVAANEVIGLIDDFKVDKAAEEEARKQKEAEKAALPTAAEISQTQRQQQPQAAQAAAEAAAAPFTLTGPGTLAVTTPFMLRDLLPEEPPFKPRFSPDDLPETKKQEEAPVPGPGETTEEKIKVDDEDVPILDPEGNVQLITVIVKLEEPDPKDETSSFPDLTPAILPVTLGITATLAKLLGRGGSGGGSSTSFGGGSISFSGPTIVRAAAGQTGLHIIKDGKGTITLQVGRTPIRRYTILGRGRKRRASIGSASPGQRPSAGAARPRKQGPRVGFAGSIQRTRLGLGRSKQSTGIVFGGPRQRTGIVFGRPRRKFKI